MCVAALFLTGQRGADSVLLAGCVGTRLGLVMKAPRALCLRRSSSGDAGGVRDSVCIGRVGAVLSHAVWAHRGVPAGAQMEGGAAEMRRGSEAGGMIGLPLVT